VGILLASHIVLRLKPPIPANVEDACAALSEDTSDEKPAVALRRVLLAAHHSHSVTLCLPNEVQDALGKLRRRCNPGVQHEALVIVVLVGGRASTELVSEVHVPDATCRHRLPQDLLVELRDKAGPGAGPDVNKHIYAVGPQQSQEPLDGVARVADGEDRRIPRCSSVGHLRSVPCVSTSPIPWSSTPGPRIPAGIIEVSGSRGRGGPRGQVIAAAWGTSPTDGPSKRMGACTNPRRQLTVAPSANVKR